MQRIFLWSGGLLALAILYLALWPVPIDPVAWNAPEDKGYTGVFAENTELANLEMIDIGDIHGPEDVAARIEEGQMIAYTSSQDGKIIRLNTVTKAYEVIANTGGVPLGLHFDSAGNLIVADAFLGLLSLDATGKISVLTNEAAGIAINYADELDIAADGKIYFSDASVKFGAKAAGTTLAASLLEIMEHGKTGRILVYDPADKSTKVIAKDLAFSNGVAMCANDDCILVAETGGYAVHKYWLTKDRYGERETIIANLPGFPDNINRGQDGRFWVGLTSGRTKALDDVSARPFLRKLSMRLPESMRVQPTYYGMVFAIDENGQVLAQYQDPSGAYPMTTGASEPGDGWLYIGSLTAPHLARKDLSGESFGN